MNWSDSYGPQGQTWDWPCCSPPVAPTQYWSFYKADWGTRCCRCPLIKTHITWPVGLTQLAWFGSFLHHHRCLDNAVATYSQYTTCSVVALDPIFCTFILTHRSALQKYSYPLKLTIFCHATTTNYNVFLLDSYVSYQQNVVHNCEGVSQHVICFSFVHMW